MDRQDFDFTIFNKGALFFFALLGISFETNPRRVFIYIYRIVLFCICLLTVQLYGFVVEGKGKEEEISFVVNMTSYFNLTIVKLLFMMYKRASLIKSYEQFKEIYPNLTERLAYDLEHYATFYRHLERFMSIFCASITTMYLMTPLAQSTWTWLNAGQFPLKLPMPLWFPAQVTHGMVVYSIWYLLIMFGSYCSGASIICTDLYLFGSISQLCLHFDMLSQRIMKLRPSEANSLDELISITKEHQNICGICDNINNIFSPIIILSVFSSSSIICFSLFGVLEESSFIKICLSFCLVLYELKETALVCYFGNRLIDNSVLVFDALYNHDWMDGSREYQRHVLFMMMNTLRPKELRVPGVATISLLTLKEVLTISYRLFAVFTKN